MALADISAQGTIAQSDGSGTTTISVTTVNVGGVVVLICTAGGSNTRNISSVSSSHTTGWAQLAPMTNATGGTTRQGLWWATITSVATANITVTWSASVIGQTCRYRVQEFFVPGGNATWLQDGSGATQDNIVSSTTINWPTLTPSDVKRVYVGRMVGGGSSTDNTITAGYVDQIDANNNAYVYNLATPVSAQSPTNTQSPTGTSFGSAALIYATVPDMPGGPFRRVMAGVLPRHHDDPGSSCSGLSYRRHRSGLHVPERRLLRARAAA